MRKLVILSLMVFTLNANAQTWDLTQEQPRYSDATGYGYDFTASPTKKSTAPFYFSVKVPDGNYKVTVTIGSKKKAAETVIRAESRRLFVENTPTKKGQFKTFSFIVNKRSPYINEKQNVRIKDREVGSLNWDDRLTLEFNGPNPAVKEIKIEPDNTATTIFLCGNSTVVDQDKEPWASWGQMIPCWFTDQIAISNHAESGLTASSFIAQYRLTVAFFGRWMEPLKNAWFVFDTLGLALFTIAGIQKSIAFGQPFWVAIIMGCITGSAGGVIRDVLLNNEPVIFHKEIYAMACVLGGLAYWVLMDLGVSTEFSAIVSFVVTCLVRFLAVRYHISLPILKEIKEQ